MAARPPSFLSAEPPEGYLLSISREEFGHLLDGTDLSLLIVGGVGIGHVTVKPEGGGPVGDMEPLQIETLLKAENITARFASLVRRYARASISGMMPKFIASEEEADAAARVVGKPTLRISQHIIKELLGLRRKT